MISHIISINNLKQWEDKLKADALAGKTTIQPRILVVGDSCDDLNEFYIIFNDITYKVESLLRAVDAVIKICFTFKLKYSQKSKYVWVFLQNYVYNIPSQEKIPKLETILSKLRKT